MSTVARLLTGAAATILVFTAGCRGDYDGGYDKVAVRDRPQIAMAAAPDPPPVVAGIGGAAAAAVPTLAAGAPAGVTQAMVESGAQHFRTVCAACHGPGGGGTAAAPVLADQEWLNIAGSYDEIVGVITTGVPNPEQFPAPMPPLGGGSFSPDQVRELAAYVFALSHAPA